MEDKPNYYAIIPATVRYDNRLNPNTKLLYGELTALCNKEGYCWATNSYFAKLYGVSNQAVSGWINKLKSLNYITVEMVYEENTKHIKNRFIYIKDTFIPIKENLNTPIKENFKDNNIKDNITIKTTTTKEDNENIKHSLGKPNIFIKPTKEEVFEFGRSINAKYDLEYFFNYYEVINWTDNNGNHFNWKQKMLTWNLSEESKLKKQKRKKVTNIPDKKEEQEFKPL